MVSSDWSYPNNGNTRPFGIEYRFFKAKP